MTDPQSDENLARVAKAMAERRHDLTLFRRMADRATILPLDALARMTAMTNPQRTLRTDGGQRA